MRSLIFLVVLVLLPMARGVLAAEVVFLEIHDREGKPIQLEPEGRFAHVAIRTGEKWLHAYPYEGVTLIDDFGDYGHAYMRMRNSSIPDPSPEKIKAWLGKPFDHLFLWDNPMATYCSRLVADLLDIAPRPMDFDSSYWRTVQGAPKGRLGLSPDELFVELWRRGFRPVTCAGLLVGS